jgi:hypothetical protein
MRFALTVGFLGLSLAMAHAASNSVSAWIPIFKGIEQAAGTNNGGAVELSVNALRIDLQDPDIRLFVTPPASNYVANSRETFLQTPREFLLEHGLSVAINSGQFSPAGYNNPSGTPAGGGRFGDFRGSAGFRADKPQRVALDYAFCNQQRAHIYPRQLAGDHKPGWRV